MIIDMSRIAAKLREHDGNAMIDPSIIQGLRQVADQLDGSSTATWLRRVADELERKNSFEQELQQIRDQKLDIMNAILKPHYDNDSELHKSNTHDVA